MPSENIGRRGLLKRGVGFGLVASATGLAADAVPVVAQGATTPAAGDDSDIDTLKADVRAAYDKANSDLDRLGADVTDDTRDSYDELKQGFDAIGDELTKAETIPPDSARESKRAYRDIQHRLEDLDDEADRALHQVNAAGKDPWHGIREALHSVHQSADHVIDAL